GRAQMRPLAASAGDLESLLPVLHGRVSLIALANRRSDIETALRLAKEFRLKLILAGAAEGWEIAGAIAAAGVPVLVEPMDNIPGYDSLGIRYENAEGIVARRSEEHTSELQSRFDLVCRLLLEKKKKKE